MSCLGPACPACQHFGWHRWIKQSEKSNPNSNQTLQPVESLDPKKSASHKTRLGIGEKKKNPQQTQNIYWVFTQKVLKQNPTKYFKLNFVWVFFLTSSCYGNATSLAELWGCSFLYYFHIYCFTYSTDFLLIEKLQEQQSIVTVMLLRVMKLQSRK